MLLQLNMSADTTKTGILRTFNYNAFTARLLQLPGWMVFSMIAGAVVACFVRLPIKAPSCISKL